MKTVKAFYIVAFERDIENLPEFDRLSLAITKAAELARSTGNKVYVFQSFASVKVTDAPLEWEEYSDEI